MRKLLLITLLPALAIAATTGITTQQTMTAPPVAAPNTSNANVEGTSLGHARADHQHKVEWNRLQATIAPSQLLLSSAPTPGSNEVASASWVESWINNATPGLLVPSQVQPVAGADQNNYVRVLRTDSDGTVRVNGGASIMTAPPAASDPGVVVRNIPSGTQTVSISGTPTVTVSGGTIAQEATLSSLNGKVPSGLSVTGGRLAVEGGAAVMTAPPAGGEAGVVVRNVPSGTQAVSGSVSISGTPTVSLSGGTIAVSNFPATQPVSAVSLPLPTGAATEATLGGIKAGTDRIPAGLTVTSGRLAVEGGSAVMTAAPTGTEAGVVVRNIPSGTQTVTLSGGSVNVGNFPATQTVSGTVAATQSGTWTVQPGNTANTTPWLVTSRVQDGSGNAVASAIAAPAGTERGLIVRNIPSGTQAVSGTVTANLGTIAGVATETTLASVNTEVTSIDSKLPAGLTVTANRLAVEGGAAMMTAAPTGTESGIVVRNIPSGTQAVSGSIGISGTVASAQSGTWTVQPGNTANTTPWLVSSRLYNSGGTAIATATTTPLAADVGLVVRNIPSGTQAVSGTFWQATQPVSIASQPLPTGASTEATLSAVNGKLPAALDADGGFKVHVQNSSGSTTGQGAAAAVSGAWPIKVTDGTNVATVTAGGALTVTGTAAVTSAAPTGSDLGVVVRNAVGVATANNTGTCTSVGTVSATVLVSNANRRSATVLNNGTVNVHMKLGATATTSNPPLKPGQSFTMDGVAVYTGVVDVISSSGTNSVCVYEW